MICAGRFPRSHLLHGFSGFITVAGCMLRSLSCPCPPEWRGTVELADCKLGRLIVFFVGFFAFTDYFGLHAPYRSVHARACSLQASGIMVLFVGLFMITDYTTLVFTGCSTLLRRRLPRGLVHHIQSDGGWQCAMELPRLLSSPGAGAGHLR